MRQWCLAGTVSTVMFLFSNRICTRLKTLMVLFFVFSSFYGVTWCLCNTVTIMSQKVKDLMLLLYENAYSALFLSFYFSSVNRTAGTS